jgi:hypothetical protein
MLVNRNFGRYNQPSYTGNFTRGVYMILFNPKKYQREHADEKSRNIALKTIEFFESKGLKKIKQDDQAGEWYQDFIDFIKAGAGIRHHADSQRIRGSGFQMGHVPHQRIQ